MRRSFFLMLLGAVVAKGQQTQTTGMPEANTQILAELALKLAKENQKLMQEQIDLLKLRLKPKSGYCPIDGTQGVELGIVAAGAPSSDPWFSGTVGTVEPPMKLLRCPHCGMLFTELQEPRKSER